ncbi:MAG: carboxylating nicotinate-nucleotide diphosphorylase [Flavobacteriales bacterium]|nr:carboxylating nicotinate-nucleotide diphosphorylase [Flavobacteriales bacterium]
MIVLPASTDELIDRAFREDVGDGDHTTLATIPEGSKGAARLLVKQDGILAGVELAEHIAKRFDPELSLRVYIIDGARVSPPDIAFDLRGPQRSILTVERVMLNFMQRLGGIATLTRQYVDAVEGTKCEILDTRKTTPGLRELEKWAVRLGGGTNHRLGLHDMIMIKDNHADMCGGIPQAIAAAKEYLQRTGKDLPIEVETRNLEEVELVMRTGGVQRVMLDNFTPYLLRKAIDRIEGKYITEASGGITLETIRSYAETGVDSISIGALTHSARALDLSLKAH